MSHQPDIPLSKLYHQRLARKLMDVDKVRLRLSIARGFELGYRERLLGLLGRRAPDGVLLHIRSIFTRKAALVTSYSSGDGKRYVLHPFLFARHEFGGWEQIEAGGFDNSIALATRETGIERNFGAPLPGMRIFGFRLRDLNYVAGAALGLDEWAVEDELFALERFSQVCLERNIPCFVLGPTPIAASAVKNRLCNTMNKALSAKLAGTTTSFCCLDGMADRDRCYFENDGFHLTEDGHRFVARLLYSSIAHRIKDMAMSRSTGHGATE